VATVVTAEGNGLSNEGIWIWDVEAKEPSHAVRQIEMRGLMHPSSPAWSPDGSQIAFGATPDGGGYADLWTVPVAGGPAERLADIPGDESGPAWSPDGSYIAFTWGTDNETRGPGVPPVTGGYGTGDTVSDIGILRLTDGAYASVTDAPKTLLLAHGPSWVPGH
jgi:Tol biopolymer transport system component